MIRLLALSISMAVVPWAAAAQSTGDADAGRIYAEARCAQCHAVDVSGESPYSPAPAFRTLYTRYPVENLAEALAEGIGVGHRGEVQMPEFVLTPEEIDNLLAYLTELGLHGNGTAETQ